MSHRSNTALLSQGQRVQEQQSRRVGCGARTLGLSLPIDDRKRTVSLDCYLVAQSTELASDLPGCDFGGTLLNHKIETPVRPLPFVFWFHS